MVLLSPPECQFGEKAPDFSLMATDGQYYDLDRARGAKGSLVMFICNHCPYVKVIIDQLVEDVKELQAQGVGVIAIMSNDVEAYPADSFENMKIFAEAHQFTFPYVIDPEQDVAKAYGAVCTPDFFAYNGHLSLQYRGRFNDVNPARKATSETKQELSAAMIQIVKTGAGPKDQIASMGCSLKWRKP